MPRYIIRLGARSVARLTVTPYFDETRLRTYRFNLGSLSAVVFDRFVDVAEASVPSGFIVQTILDASNIDQAMQIAEGVAAGVLSMVSCVAAASVSRPFVEFAYDASSSVTPREFVLITHDRTTPASTTRAPEEDLGELLTQYDRFFSDPQVTDDYKERIGRAIHAYRRALADNDDVLTEFLVLWSSMEAMDCIYRKTFPSRQADFMDGVRDVFNRLGHGTVFDALKSLRDDVAHGNLDLAAATNTASSNLPLARKALLLMMLRLLRVRDDVRDRIVGRPGYKGNVTTHVRLNATITFSPGEVDRLDGHPEVRAHLNGIKTSVGAETISIDPDWRFTPQNCAPFSLLSVTLRGDAGANVRVNGLGVAIIPKDAAT